MTRKDGKEILSHSHKNRTKQEINASAFKSWPVWNPFTSLSSVCVTRRLPDLTTNGPFLLQWGAEANIHGGRKTKKKGKEEHVKSLKWRWTVKVGEKKKTYKWNPSFQIDIQNSTLFFGIWRLLIYDTRFSPVSCIHVHKRWVMTDHPAGAWGFGMLKPSEDT